MNQFLEKKLMKVKSILKSPDLNKLNINHLKKCITQLSKDSVENVCLNMKECKEYANKLSTAKS